MTICPYCHSDFSGLPAVPGECPQCHRELPSSEMRTMADPGEMQNRGSDDPTIDSDELLEMPLSSEPSAELSEDNLKTVASDEWDDPSNAKTMQSDDSFDLDAGSAAEVDPGNARTVQSDEFSWGDVPSEAGGGSPDEMRTVAGDFDDPSNDRTVQSEEFALSDALGGEDSSNQKTMMSEEIDAFKTMASQEISQDAAKSMQTMWSGAFHGPTNPGMTLRGAENTPDSPAGSTLVIRPRQMTSPGERAAPERQAEYELIRVLGEGGMGVVYDARQTSVDRAVAVKMLKPRTSQDERQRQKFLAEAVVTGDLDHPNIVPIYDVGTSERGMLFYAMKKVKGTPWMKSLPGKSLAENLEILMKVADAVGFAHARGVIHRDLKPENVMLGDFGEVLVMDWGLALPAPGYNKSKTISPAHSMGGTPAYMSPEMASGPLDKITFASDVYLLGAILYEILTGRPPHSGKNTMQCLFAAAKNDIRPTDKTGELVDIARKAMATAVEERYQTVRAFQDAIRNYQSHTESIALSTRAAEETRKAEQTDDYRDFSRALFAYEESLNLWADNARARSGLTDVRYKYATTALRKGDYDLGLSLVDPAEPDHAQLAVRLKDAQRERDAKQKRLRAAKQLAATLAALFVIVVSVAFVWIRNERDAAVSAREKEQEAREEAVAQKVKAVEEEEKAIAAKKVAETEEQKARVAEGKARKEELNAREAEKKAREEEQNALKAYAQAEVERVKAVKAKDQEEYEAYIARIGLAAAKIDENAFGSARKLLDECKPELRNWEWGRLKYLCEQSEGTIDGKAPLNSVSFSPDGKQFVTGGWNRTADVWETATGRHLASIPHEGIYVHAVAWSPTEPVIATGSNDREGLLRLSDAGSGALIRKFEGHTDDILSLAFSKDGKRLLSTSYDRTARLWEVATGKELQVFKGHHWWVWSAAFSPDESQIVTVSQDGTAIVWSVESGRQIGQFLGHSGPVYAVAYSPDGHVATGGYSRRILIWDPADLRPFDFKKLASGDSTELPPFVALDGHSAGVRSLSFSEKGELLLSGSHDNTVRVWESATGRSLKTFRGHDSWVRACAFSPDQKTIVSVSHDRHAKLWNLLNYEEFRVLRGKSLKGHDDAVLAASFSQDGEMLVTASRDRTARTWNVDSGRELRTFDEGHAFLASNAVFFPDGRRLLTAAVDNTMRLWDVTSGSQVYRVEHTGRSAALALSHNARWALTGSDDKSARLWDAETGGAVRSYTGHRFEVTAVAFSPDDSLVFTGDSGGSGILWETATGKLVHRLKGHTGKISAAIFVGDGSRLVTASNDKTVAQWDVAKGVELSDLVLRHDGAVLSISLIPETRHVLTSSADGRVRLWDIDGATATTLVQTDPQHHLISAAVASPNGRLALTVDSESRTVHLWDLATGREMLKPADDGRTVPFLDFARRGSQLWMATFSPDSESVLTVGGTDIRLWDAPAGEERISFSPNGVVAAAGFSPDGSRIVTGSWDSSARVWNVASGRDELKLMGQHTSYVNTAVYSPDGEMILTASDDKSAVLWNARTGAVVRVLEGHGDRVRSAVFSPDGKLILTGSNDRTARLWETASGAELRRFVGHRWAVLSVAFSVDSEGSRIITGSDDNSARIWETATGKELLSLEGHTAAVSSVAFLPNIQPGKAGNRVITGSLDNSAKLWDSVTGQEILTLKGHSQEVTCVNAAPAGRYLVTGSRDGTALLWPAIDWTKPAARNAAEKALSAKE